MAVRMKDSERSWALNRQHSKVLRIARTLAPDTRRRALKRTRKLNFQPNFAARALVTGQDLDTWPSGS
jgi:LacI family transcriptional regulator